MAITADRNVRVRPVTADLADKPADMSGRFLAGRRLAPSQQHGHRPAAGSVVHVDGQEAALAIMPIPERQLLIAVNHVTGVIDVQRHRSRRLGIAGTVDAHHALHHPRQLQRRWRILPAAHRGLAHQTRPRLHQLAQRQAERRIMAQGIKVIGILVPTGDRQYPGLEDLSHAMGNPHQIARIGNTGCQRIANPQRALGHRQQQHPAVRAHAATVKRSCDLLAAHRWKRKQERAIIASGGSGPWHFLSWLQDGFNTHFLTSGQCFIPPPPTQNHPAGE